MITFGAWANAWAFFYLTKLNDMKKHRHLILRLLIYATIFCISLYLFRIPIDGEIMDYLTAAVNATLIPIIIELIYQDRKHKKKDD